MAKVACVCNQNNIFFSLVRHLRSRDVNAELFLLNNEEKHFHPSNDSFSDDYQNYTTQLPWGSLDTFLTFDKEETLKIFAEFDFIIATDNAIAFLTKAGVSIDLIFPLGGDLTNKSLTYKSIPLHARLLYPAAYKFSKYMEKGFKNAGCINVEKNLPQYKSRLREMGVDSKVNYFGTPMSFIEEFDISTLKSAQLDRIETLRNENDLLILNHARLSWDFSSDTLTDSYHNKGTDKLIKGFAKFIQKHPEAKAVLILLEYGKDIESSKALVENAKISDKVVFLPLLSRKEIYSILRIVDFGCGQFYAGGIGGGTTWEVLASGVPLLHYIEDIESSFYSFDSPFPFVNLREEIDYSSCFESYINDSSPYIKMGVDGQKWYQRNLIDESLHKHVSLINQKVGTTGSN